MTDKDKLEKLKKLADAMYYAAQHLTTDASRLHKAMDEYHKFIIHECKEKPISEEFEKALAEEWQGYVDRGAATVDALEDNTQELAFAKGFYRGANWQKEQMMRDAKSGIGTYDNYIQFEDGTWIDLDPTMQLKPAFNVKKGGKVKVLVIKDE